jgi:phage FluMu protein Com
MNEKKAQPKIIKCEKCNKVYLAFDGLKYDKAEDQPCPHCLVKGEKNE